jgi:transposase
MTVKTDRKDGRGLAQLIRMGWFRPVHAKSIRSQEVRALLVARKQLLGRLIDVELSIRGILRGFSLILQDGLCRGIDRLGREYASRSRTRAPSSQFTRLHWGRGMKSVAGMGDR